MSWLDRLRRKREPQAIVAELAPFGTMQLDERVSAWIGEVDWLGAPVTLMIEQDFDTADAEPALPGARRLFEEAAHWDGVARAAILRDMPEAAKHWRKPDDPEWTPEGMLGWLTLRAISASRDFHQLEYDAGGRLADHSVVVTLDWGKDTACAEIHG